MLACPLDFVFDMLIDGKEIYELCLIPTERCNLRCVYCLVDKEHGHTMSFATAQRAIDEMMAESHPFDYYKISYMGGEPLLNLPLLMQIEEYIQRVYPTQDIRYEIVTYGTLLNERAKEWLLSVKDKTTFVVSIDGGKETDDAHRSNSFDQVNISFAQRMPHARINMVITPDSLPKTLENRLLLAQYGIPVRMFMEEGLRWRYEHLAVFESVLMELVTYYLEHNELEPCHLLNNSLYLLEDDSLVLGCAQHSYSYAISADGERYDCHRCMPFENFGELQIPQQYIHDLSAAKFLNPNCTSCYIHELCNSCPASNASIIHRPEASIRCQMMKILYRAQAFFYLNLLVANPSNPMVAQYSRSQNINMVKAAEHILRTVDSSHAF